MEAVKLDIAVIRTDGDTQSRAQLNWVTLDRYTELMAEGTIFPPVVVFFDGESYWLSDGFHRVEAARRAGGIGAIDADVRPGTRRDAKLYSLGANKDHGLPPSPEDTKQAILTMLTDDEWKLWPQADIARHVGVTPAYVSQVKLSIKHLIDRPAERVVSRNGTTFTMNVSNIGQRDDTRICPYCSRAYRGNGDEVTQCPYCSRLHMYSGLWNEEVYGPNPHTPSLPIQVEPVKPTTLEVMHSSNSIEWYTPAAYVESARAVMGGIDLDPASCARANETVRASRYYSPEKNEDGYTLPWSGRVWLNPPYGRTESNQSNQARWTLRLIQEHGQEKVQAAVLLVSANTGEKWFQNLWRFPMCFTNHRINFYGPPDQQVSGPNHGSVLVYFGKDLDAFRTHFQAHGRIVIPRAVYSEALV